MQTFIVLGIIPGTHYQTTFDFWLYVAISLMMLPVLVRLIKLSFRLRHTLRAHRAARKIDRYINQHLLTA